jgi:glutamate 5-kinase
MIPAARESLARTRRVVVKVGSRVLVQRNGRPDPRRMSAVVNGLATLNHSDRDVVVVSSGAIAAACRPSA